MIDCRLFYDTLLGLNINFFTGVPDSLLKEICLYISDHSQADKHIIAANEGSALAIAAGYHLSTGSVPVVYLQNSGIGNLINPLLSLASEEVYKIPMLLMIGWRGEPGIKDEPQHMLQGRIQNKMLEIMNVPYCVIGPDSNFTVELADMVSKARTFSRPVAVIIRKDTFKSGIKHEMDEMIAKQLIKSREFALDCILQSLTCEDLVVVTTGMASREVFELRERSKSGHQCDFLTVGSMGHCSQIAAGVALSTPSRSVYCLDGDGSVIMHMGGLAIIGSLNLSNLKHIIINNGCHDSVGGQPTAGFHACFCTIARGCGYDYVAMVDTEEDLSKELQTIRHKPGPLLLEIRVRKGARHNLGRPTTSPKENKEAFMANVSARGSTRGSTIE